MLQHRQMAGTDHALEKGSLVFGAHFFLQFVIGQGGIADPGCQRADRKGIGRMGNQADKWFCLLYHRK